MVHMGKGHDEGLRSNCMIVIDDRHADGFYEWRYGITGQYNEAMIQDGMLTMYSYIPEHSGNVRSTLFLASAA